MPCTVCVLTAGMATQQVIKAANTPTIRLLSTKAAPALPLAKGHKWHLFLSHIWSTGQDQCATIKRQLCLLLRGASIFLDVDDLQVLMPNAHCPMPYAQCRMPSAQCPMPSAQCPMLIAQCLMPNTQCLMPNA